MSLDQFNQVVEAISEGRYSWACVLILRFAGYNPIHYIPYRTYSRLLKENTQTASRAAQAHIQDLTFQDGLTQKESAVHGGSFIGYGCLKRWILDFSKN